MNAANNGHEQIVEVLVRCGAAIDHQGVWSALMLAAREGHEGVVEILLRGGADVNLISCCGLPALTYAAGGKHPSIVKRLLEAGAATEVGLRSALSNWSTRSELKMPDPAPSDVIDAMVVPP